MQTAAEYNETQDTFRHLRLVHSTKEPESGTAESVVEMSSAILGYDVLVGWAPTPDNDAAHRLEQLLEIILGYSVSSEHPQVRLDELRERALVAIAQMSSDEDDDEEIARRSAETAALLEAQMRSIDNRDSGNR